MGKERTMGRGRGGGEGEGGGTKLSSSAPGRGGGRRGNRAESRRRALTFEQNKRIIDYSSSRDWRGILGYAEDNFATFNDVNWATMFSRLGRMRREAGSIADDGVFITVTRAFKSKVEDEGFHWIGVRQLANIVHGYESIGVAGRSAFFERVAADAAGAERIAKGGNCQEISNLLWAFAKSGTEAPALCSFVDNAQVAEKFVREGTSQAFANVLWAMARLRHEPTAFANAIAKKDFAREMVRNGSPQSISITVWAMAKLGIKAPALVSEIDQMDASDRIVADHEPQNISNLLW